MSEHEATAGQAGIEITPEMVAAGEQVLLSFEGEASKSALAEWVFRAMLEASPQIQDAAFDENP